MPLNLGYIEATVGDREVVIRVYYDNTLPASDSQPLINGPRGFCLDVTNTTGRKAKLTVTPASGSPLTFTVAQGDPVTTGPTAGRSRTAAQMAALGFTTRGSVGNFELSD